LHPLLGEPVHACTEPVEAAVASQHTTFPNNTTSPGISR
jgi:hypothetical protein